MDVKYSVNNKPAIVAVGLYVSGTGFTRVLETLFSHLYNHFDIHWMGIGYKGPVIATEHYTLHPVNSNGGDIYGAYGAAAMAEKINAQSILLLNDFYLLKNYQRPFEALKANGIQLVAYVPLDGYFTATALTAQCLFLDKLVLYNEWALQEVRHSLNECLHETVNKPIPQLSYIYHGTDTHFFTPIQNSEKKAALKSQFFNVPDAANSIFILNANRYNERKDIESSITAFAMACAAFKHPAYLCLHTPNLQEELCTRLKQCIEQSGCSDKILLNPLGNRYCNNEQLAALYGVCDIGLNTSFGEGWGMISFEHAACGGAQIVPGHTTPGELWKDAGILIPASEKIQLSTNPFEMRKINSNVLANELTNVVNDAAYRNQVAAACMHLVNKDDFNWENIAAQWVKVLSPTS